MSNNSELKLLQAKIKKWDDKEDPLAELDDYQLSIINEIEELSTKSKIKVCGIFFSMIAVIKVFKLLK
jgi:hypothetical protein